LSILTWIWKQIYSFKFIIKIGVSGIFGYLTVLALLIFLSAETGQGALANFYAQLTVGIFVFVIVFILLSFVKRLR